MGRSRKFIIFIMVLLLLISCFTYYDRHYDNESNNQFPTPEYKLELRIEIEADDNGTYYLWLRTLYYNHGNYSNLERNLEVESGNANLSFINNGTYLNISAIGDVTLKSEIIIDGNDTSAPLLRLIGRLLFVKEKEKKSISVNYHYKGYSPEYLKTIWFNTTLESSGEWQTIQFKTYLLAIDTMT